MMDAISLSRCHYYHISPNEITISQHQMFDHNITEVYISDDKNYLIHLIIKHLKNML